MTGGARSAPEPEPSIRSARRALFEAFYRGWLTCEHGKSCDPPELLTPAGRREYVRGYQARCYAAALGYSGDGDLELAADRPGAS